MLKITINIPFMFALMDKKHNYYFFLLASTGSICDLLLISLMEILVLVLADEQLEEGSWKPMEVSKYDII